MVNRTRYRNELGQIDAVGAFGRQPGVNTVAYYPLDLLNTILDRSGNNRSLNNYNNVQFIEYQGVDCAYFNGNNALFSTEVINSLLGQNFTILGRCYLEGIGTNRCVISNNASGGYRGWNIDYWWNYSGMNHILRNEFLPSGGNLVPLKPINDNKRHFFCYTHNSNNNSVGYTDMTNATNTQSITMDGIQCFCIGGRKRSSGDTPHTLWKGGISGIIIENKARTQEEITAYYNQTKNNYL